MRADKPRILVVDDEPMNISVLVSLLSPDYAMLVAKNGKQALAHSRESPAPDLILLDVMMPDMDGYAVCQHLKEQAETRDIPVIFVTAMGEVADEERGLKLGAVDYIAKPFSPAIVKARIGNHVELKRARDAMADMNRVLERKVAERTHELTVTQDVAILSLASLAETRDNETGNHIRRTQGYVRVLATHLAAHPKFKDYLDERTVDLLHKSASLHDIGKVGVPDAILLKPGKLTPEEFDVIKKHPIYGRDALLKAEAMLGSTSFLRFAREIAYGHHEKWDGSGYPEGLAGDAIPVSARLMAIADVYDALICKRVYKEPMGHAEASAIIRQGRGKHFDPDMVDVFETISDQFVAIAQAFSDQ